MKKIFFSLVALAALAACTKSEAVYTPSAEIGFMPVSKYDTKAAVESTTYTDALPFYVYANAKNNGAAGFTSKYFENALFVFEKTESTTTHIYKGDPAQYWPNVNPLIFAGFTKSGNIETLVTNDVTNKSDVVIAPSADLTTLTINGYQQPEPTVGPADNDFMYFFADNDDDGYTSQSTYIIPVMKHACSWITINIKAESAALLAYWKDLKVTEVKFVKLHTTGTVTLTKGSPAEWDFTDQTESSVDVKALSASAKPITIDTGVEFADIAKNTIVLPQQPAYLSVTYTYTTPAGTEGFTETKVLPLNFNNETRDLDDTDDEYRATWKEWEPGKHYIYNLTVTSTEIKIAPTSKDWVTDLNSNDEDDDNIGKDI